MIVNLYRQRIMSYCYRMLGAGAEDAAQEIFIKFYLALNRFDASKPVSPFLFRIAHNHCLDILKKKRIRTTSFKTGAEDEQEIRIADEGPNPEEILHKAELRDAVNRAISEMPSLYRSPLIMWHVEGISYDEIAEIMGLPIGTIKARIHRGRNILQQKLINFVSINGECI